MARGPHTRVAQPPATPVMIFDGDCHFCRRWIERWREMTGERVEYVSSQEAGGRFPEIAPEEFERSVQLVEPNGDVYHGAAAVLRSLGYGGMRWPLWSYEQLPGCAPLAEFSYRLVARHRGTFSALTRFFWGADVRRPTYTTARDLFLRALGLIFLIAFVSLWTQVDGLIGSDGISPFAEYLKLAREQLGTRAVWLLPTLGWFNPSNAFLHFLCGAGALFSLLLMAGVLPVFSLIALYVLYLSLTIAGQTFLSFQWDILLLETGFLAIFLAPWQWRLRQKNETPVPRAGLLLLRLLLFKLMFMSGMVKLTSGDDSWANLTALNYHYETQPLPTVLGWWAHQGPEWFKHFGVAFVLFVEVVVPFFIWAPRRLRLGACGFLIALQIFIGLTGNYAFFNLLTIALCLLLVDDGSWPAFLRAKARKGGGGVRFANACAVAVLLLTLPANAWLLFSACRPEAEAPRIVSAFDQRLAPFRIANGYGLFRVMTRTRPEIVIEGSADGIDWLPYRFRWKPGPLERAPRWVAPHQPRLDWQMWFAALGSVRSNPWFLGLATRLLEGSPSVLALFEQNPFPQKPPRYLRAILYQYHFASLAERRATGHWWRREEKREYLPTVSLPQ